MVKVKASQISYFRVFKMLIISKFSSTMVKVKALQIAILEPRIYGGHKNLRNLVENHATNVEIRGCKRDTDYIRCTIDV